MELQEKRYELSSKMIFLTYFDLNYVFINQFLFNTFRSTEKVVDPLMELLLVLIVMARIPCPNEKEEMRNLNNC